MGTEQIMYCIVALLLGMLLANMLKNVCGCNVVEGFGMYADPSETWGEAIGLDPTDCDGISSFGNAVTNGSSGSCGCEWWRVNRASSS